MSSWRMCQVGPDVRSTIEQKIVVKRSPPSLSFDPVVAYRYDSSSSSQVKRGVPGLIRFFSVRNRITSRSIILSDVRVGCECGWHSNWSKERLQQLLIYINSCIHIYISNGMCARVEKNLERVPFFLPFAEKWRWLTLYWTSPEAL